MSLKGDPQERLGNCLHYCGVIRALREHILGFRRAYTGTELGCITASKCVGLKMV